MLDLIEHNCKDCGCTFKAIDIDIEFNKCLSCEFPKTYGYRNNYFVKNILSKNIRYISSEVKQIVWNRDGGQCVQCNSSCELEFDHIIPVSKGGSNTEKNVQLLCKNCNRTKFNHII